MSSKRFKIATFNLYNLALPGTTFYRVRKYSETEYQQKKQWIADQLRRMDSDVVGFQEVFDADALREVIRESDVYQDATVLIGEKRGERPVVGLVSRYPVLDHGSIADFAPEAHIGIDDASIPICCFSRPVLWARIKIRRRLEVTVFVVHLKSKNPMIKEGADRHDPWERGIGKARSLILRAAEAAAMRCVLLEYMKGNDHPVIVVGDTNDTGSAVTSEIMTGSSPWRKLDREKKVRIWDVLLYNVKDIQARQSYRDTYYTHIHNGHYESLDHILVSQEFVRQNPRRLGQVEYVTLFNDHLIDETLSDETVPTWQSDHGQVVATIRLR